MKGNKRFFVGIISGLLVGALAYGIAIYLSLGVPVKSTAEPWSLIEGKAKIARNVQGPKIIVVGGSSVDMGISAKRIEALSGIPTVNLGLWAGLGPEYILYQVGKTAQPGDLVVLILEYGQFHWAGGTKHWVGQELNPIILSRDPSYLLSRPIEEQFNLMVRVSPTFLLDCLRNRILPTEGNTPEPFNLSHNSWGDCLTNTALNRPKSFAAGSGPNEPIWHLSHALPSDAKGFPIVAEFIASMRGVGVQVVACFPNVSKHEDYGNKGAKITVQRIKHFYESQQVPLLGEFEKSVYSPDLFFDTHYHLLEGAAVERSESLVPLLEPYLPSAGRDAG